MTTVAAVKKNGFVAIAADTMITFGNTRESAEYVVNHSKIFSYRDNFISVAGSAGVQLAMEEYFAELETPILLDSISSIYRFGLSFHQDLKDNHFLRPEDPDDSFETFRADVIIVNNTGIFGMSSYRYVQEYSKFYSIGSGGQFAIGAMFSIYDNPVYTAKEIAETAVLAGATFDDGTGLPVNSFELKLKDI